MRITTSYTKYKRSLRKCHFALGEGKDAGRKTVLYNSVKPCISCFLNS